MGPGGYCVGLESDTDAIWQCNQHWGGHWHYLSLMIRKSMEVKLTSHHSDLSPSS